MMEILKTSEKLISQIKQLSKKLPRISHFNLRYCMIFSIIILIIVLITLTRFQRYGSAASRQHKFRLNICQNSLNAVRLPKIIKSDNDDNDDKHYFVSDDDIWSNETVELFQDQLGIVIESIVVDNEESKRNSKCHHRGREFLMSSLPGPDAENNFYEVLWQYFSLDATEHMTIMCGDGGKKLTLRAVVTEQMKERLQQVFDGLPLETFSNFPPSCYDLKYTKIIGNVSPLDLTEITVDTPFLLDPKAKRWKEIAERWSPKHRPFWRLKADVLKEVQQEFLVAKTILQIEPSHNDNDVNFIGVYVSSEDKLPPDFYLQSMNFHRNNSRHNIFMIICDAQILPFCREIFEREKKSKMPADTRIMRKSKDSFDFILMASCNGTIVSNEMGVLHALMNGGITVVFRPESKDDPQFYVPWLMSQKMLNWHVIGNNTFQ